MASFLRRSAMVTFLVAVTGGLWVGLGAQQAAPAPTPPAPAPAPAPAQSPEALALMAATRLTDPAGKLTALEKFRADYPDSGSLTSVDLQILTTLTTWPERTDAMSTVVDRILARMPASATPETRLSSTMAAVTPLVARKLLLDRAETLVTDAMGALDFEAFASAARETAKGRNRPEPAQATLESQFNTSYRSRGLETLAKIYAAKDDAARAEDFYKQAVRAAPSNNAIVMGLVDFYSARSNYAAAETVLKDHIAAVGSRPGAMAAPTVALAEIYVKKGDSAAAEALLKETVAGGAANAAALVPLARLEAARGDQAAALDHFLTASVGGTLRTAADDALMRATWTKVHGSEAGLEAALDAMYREKFPNPVTPDKYTKSGARSNRIVLLEMFTGSGCPPCVAADLALDAVMERYPGDAVVALAYHQNIPQPDPMVVAGDEGRHDYYVPFKGVPTFNIDGGLGQLGGGARTGTAGVYKNYVVKIDKELDVPAQAALSVRATGEGDQVHVTATVSKLASGMKDVRLHLVLAEKELRFTGENGVRFHPMVVRAMAGDRGAGLPISANGKTEFTFNLSAIQDDVTKTLAAEMVKRHATEAPGSTPREYAAEGRAYTTIDTGELVVVAFLQSGGYQAPPPPPPAAPRQTLTGPPAATTPTPPAAAAQAPAPPPVPPLLGTNVLQAAKVDVVFASASKGKGGR